jgi:RecA/RadA recombinase
VGEIVGPASSGRTSLALSLLATQSRAGEFAAVVDPCDVFDPTSAEAAGVDLSQILWVRATERRAWLSIWPRLARSAAASLTSLVVLGSERVAGTFSALTLELDPAHPHFSGAPLLFEGLQGRLRLVRNRTGPSDRTAPLKLVAPHRAA